IRDRNVTGVQTCALPIYDINIAIISEDEISDNASRNLSRIRRAQKNKTQGIRDKLNGIIRSQSNALQDNIITVRDGRYVVPVKSEKRGLVKGIVHDQSSSGATVFIRSEERRVGKESR